MVRCPTFLINTIFGIIIHLKWNEIQLNVLYFCLFPFAFKGIKLRKVEKIEQKEKERSTAFHDVASILARRVAIELSESEDSDSDEDSECWVEPTETSAWSSADVSKPDTTTQSPSIKKTKKEK